MAPSKRHPIHRASPYAKIIDDLDLSAALKAGLERNDLLPPRPDDSAGGEVGDRFVAAIKQRLVTGAYEPERALIVPVPKPKYATRPAALIALADRVVYHALVEPLRARIERGLVSKTSLFWPRGEVGEKQWNKFENSPLSVGGAYVVRADVTGFYESIDHDLLADRLTSLTGKTNLVDALVDFLGQIMEQPRGLPQGIAASDALATAYLSGVDAAMLRSSHLYWRHGDDIRLTVTDHDAGRKAVHTLESNLRQARLLLNAEKTWVLHRETYEKQVGAVARERTRVQDALLAKREKGLLDAPEEDLIELAEKAGIDEQTQWDVFYHGNMSIEDIVAQLRPVLTPSHVEVAIATYDEAMRRAPDASIKETLSSEMFHGLLTTSFTTLIADRNPHALKDAASLVSRFADKTELVAAYLRSLVVVDPASVVGAVTDALDVDHYLTGWQITWLLQVMREVSVAEPDTDISPGVEFARKVASGEQYLWLARAESARLLAHAGQLDHELLSRLWAVAPATVHADLAAAVAVAATKAGEESAWSMAFLDSLNSEPMLQVVLARVRQQIQQWTSKPQPT